LHGLSARRVEHTEVRDEMRGKGHQFNRAATLLHRSPRLEVFPVHQGMPSRRLRCIPQFQINDFDRHDCMDAGGRATQDAVAEEPECRGGRSRERPPPHTRIQIMIGRDPFPSPSPVGHVTDSAGTIRPGLGRVKVMTVGTMRRLSSDGHDRMPPTYPRAASNYFISSSRRKQGRVLEVHPSHLLPTMAWPLSAPAFAAFGHPAHQR